MNKKQLHRDAHAFRTMKIKEVFSKDNPTKIELYLVTRFAEIYGDSI